MPDCLLIQGDARRLPLADRSVHCCVTSPPFFGLRDYQVKGQIGLEKTPDEFVVEMVRVFREVWRVLRDDGTLWLNLGDSYANDGKWGGHTGGKHASALHCSPIGRMKRYTGLKPKDLIGIPWRVAFALQADGWCLRSDIIWSKPNPMTESVRDRPTKAHEHLFLLTKRPRYFYDAFAVRERDAGQDHPRSMLSGQPSLEPSNGLMSPHKGLREAHGRNGAGRNMRTVLTIPAKPYKGAHFATFPPKLVTPCIKAGTSEKGRCPKCGAPWRRRTKTSYVNPGNRSTNGPRSAERKHIAYGSAGYPVRLEKRVKTLGWESSCGCLEARNPVPCVVLDPFGGVFTTAIVANRLGRSFVGTELSAPYLALAQERIAKSLRPESKLDRKPMRPLRGQLPLFD